MTKLADEQLVEMGMLVNGLTDTINDLKKVNSELIKALKETNAAYWRENKNADYNLVAHNNELLK